MANDKISNYTLTAVTMKSTDLMDVSIDDGAGGWDTKKITWTSILGALPAATTIYTGSAALAAPRLVTLSATNTLGFTGGETTFTGEDDLAGSYSLKAENSSNVVAFNVQNDGFTGFGQTTATARVHIKGDSNQVLKLENSTGVSLHTVEETGEASWSTTGKADLMQIKIQGATSQVYIGGADDVTAFTATRPGVVIGNNNNDYLTYNNGVFSMENNNGSVFKIVDTVTGKLSLGTQSATDISLITTAVSRMFIEAGGNIGLSTITPTARLHVQGVGATTGYSIKVQDNSSTQLFAIQDDGTVYSGTTACVASFGPSAVTSITVKNGLITAIS